MALALTIAGVTQEMQPEWSIDYTTNGRAVFTFKVLSAAGTYRPALDDEVILTEGGSTVILVLFPSPKMVTFTCATPVSSNSSPHS